MKTRNLFMMFLLILLNISCSENNLKDNILESSKVDILVADNIPVEVIKYHHIRDRDIIDSTLTKIEIIKDFSTFESLFAHNNMFFMDSAFFYEYYLKSVKEEDFNDYYIVAVILPKTNANQTIEIKEAYLEDRVLTVSYKQVPRSGLSGFTIAYIKKCSYNTVVGKLL